MIHGYTIIQIREVYQIMIVALSDRTRCQLIPIIHELRIVFPGEQMAYMLEGMGCFAEVIYLLPGDRVYETVFHRQDAVFTGFARVKALGVRHQVVLFHEPGVLFAAFNLFIAAE